MLYQRYMCVTLQRHLPSLYVFACKNGRVVAELWPSCAEYRASCAEYRASCGRVVRVLGELLGEIVKFRQLAQKRLGGHLCLGDTTPAILAGTKRTENSFGIIWPSPRQLRVKNTLRVGHRGPVGRKTTQKPPQNTKKWKKIVKKRLFSRFGHFGQNSDFSRKKSKTGIFFDITKPPLAQIYPKSGL